VRADCYPCLPSKDVNKQGKGRWSHFPFFSVFILVFIPTPKDSG
jgi:hypothetical protein